MKLKVSKYLTDKSIVLLRVCEGNLLISFKPMELRRPGFCLTKRLDHLGLIIDGNRRYSKKTGATLENAYKIGAKKVYDTIHYVFGKAGIKELSIYALSYDNLSRTPEEVLPILKMQKASFDQWISDPFFDEKKIRIKFVGEMNLLPLDLCETCAMLEKKTAANDAFNLNILIAYMGHREISEAVERGLKNDSLSMTDRSARIKEVERCIDENLDVTRPVDLIIRTANGFRLSGFLLWQSEYAELAVLAKLWPEVEIGDIERAIAEYINTDEKHGL